MARASLWALAAIFLTRDASCGHDGTLTSAAHAPISAVPAYGHGLDSKRDHANVATHFSAQHASSDAVRMRTDSKSSVRAKHHQDGSQMMRKKPPPANEAHEQHKEKLDTEIQKQVVAPFFDGFWFAYWGSVAAGVILLWFYMKNAPPPPFDVFSTNLEEETHLGEKRVDCTTQRRSSLLEYTFRLPVGAPLKLDDEHVIPQNIWALPLVAALGHAKLMNGRCVTPWMVFLVAVFMGCLQMMALFLMSHDLDPKAHPVTVEPSSPYGSPWTVNTMKCVMAIFMVVSLVSEAGESQRVAEISSAMPPHRLNGCPQWLPISMAVFQYIVSLSVVWAGVAVVLSFQSVPDIIYSSMSIMCIATIDQMFYEGLHAVLGLEAKWTTHREEDEKELSLGYLFACKIVLLFPVFLGLFMFVRAWMTGVMPTARMRTVIDLIHARWVS